MSPPSLGQAAAAWHGGSSTAETTCGSNRPLLVSCSARVTMARRRRARARARRVADAPLRRRSETQICQSPHSTGKALASSSQSTRLPSPACCRGLRAWPATPQLSYTHCWNRIEICIAITLRMLQSELMAPRQSWNDDSGRRPSQAWP